MPHLARFLCALAALGVTFTSSSVEAQYCIGSTAYTVRNAAGDPMSPEEMQRLTIVSVNGEPARSSVDRASQAVYEAPFGTNHSPYRIPLANPLELATMAQCGEIRELVLRFDGVTMRLTFAVPHHNTRYHFDSLPFQAGHFRARSVDPWHTFPCDDGGGPPLIDNENHGECRVPPRNWARLRRRARRQ